VQGYIEKYTYGEKSGWNLPVRNKKMAELHKSRQGRAMVCRAPKNLGTGYAGYHVSLHELLAHLLI
jgi:hypothetical protein